MPVTRTVLYDGPDRTDWRDDDPSIGYTGFGTDWKAGSAPYNADQITTKLRSMTALFATNTANWATMTAAQKDTANRQAQRGLANLCRMVLNDLTDAGV